MKNRVKEYLRREGITQEELAKRLDVTTASLSMTLAKPMLKYSTYERYAKALGVPPWMLMLTDDEVRDIAESVGVTPMENDTFRCPVCSSLLNVSVAQSFGKCAEQ